MNCPFENKVALVTGMGLTTAKAFAEAGAAGFVRWLADKP